MEETTGNVGNFRALMVLLSRKNDIIRQKLTLVLEMLPGLDMIFRIA